MSRIAPPASRNRNLPDPLRGRRFTRTRFQAAHSTRLTDDLLILLAKPGRGTGVQRSNFRYCQLATYGSTRASSQ